MNPETPQPRPHRQGALRSRDMNTSTGVKEIFNNNGGDTHETSLPAQDPELHHRGAWKGIVLIGFITGLLVNVTAEGFHSMVTSNGPAWLTTLAWILLALSLLVVLGYSLIGLIIAVGWFGYMKRRWVARRQVLKNTAAHR